MDAIVKVLVAAACVCVIAVSGHYGYATYQSYLADQRRADQAQASLMQIAKEAGEQRDAERQRRAARALARQKELAEKRNARKAERAAAEREKQAARDNAASMLKDAVID